MQLLREFDVSVNFLASNSFVELMSASQLVFEVWCILRCSLSCLYIQMYNVDIL